MTARPKDDISDEEDWMKSIGTESTRENGFYRTGPNLGRVRSRKLEHFESLEPVPGTIALYQESETYEEDWMKEVEIEYTREVDLEEAVDPLADSVDWARQSRGNDGNGKSEHFGKGPFKLARDIMECQENDSDDEEWMEEVEFEYTREEVSGIAVDPLGDAGHRVLVEQKNISDKALHYCVDSTDEMEYIAVDQSGLVGIGNNESGHSAVLFVDVYASKSNKEHVTETPIPYSGANRLNEESTAPEHRKSFACRLCDYQSRNRYDFHKHCRAHHGEKSFENALKNIRHPRRGKQEEVCSICGRRFSLMGWLVRHMKKAHKREPSTVRNSLSTKRRPTNRSKRKKTSARDEPAPSSSAEDDSVKPQDTSDDFTAGVKNNQSYKLQTENEGVPIAIEKPYACKLCEYRTSWKHDLKKHELNHNGDKPYKCTKCSYSYKRAGNLEIHMGAHNDRKTETDGVIRGGENNHRKQVSDESGRESEVVLFGSAPKPLTSSSGGSISICYNQRNGNGKMHHCTICHYRTNQMGNLRVHLQTHMGERPFVCSVCHKRFTQSGSLKIHMRNHTGERPYLCNVCGKGFSQITNRNTHRKTCPYPPGIKMCDICNYRCKRNRELWNHMKIHCSVRVIRL